MHVQSDVCAHTGTQVTHVAVHLVYFLEHMGHFHISADGAAL